MSLKAFYSKSVWLGLVLSSMVLVACEGGDAKNPSENSVVSSDDIQWTSQEVAESMLRSSMLLAGSREVTQTLYQNGFDVLLPDETPVYGSQWPENPFLVKPGEQLTEEDFKSRISRFDRSRLFFDSRTVPLEDAKLRSIEICYDDGSQFHLSSMVMTYRDSAKDMTYHVFGGVTLDCDPKKYKRAYVDLEQDETIDEVSVFTSKELDMVGIEFKTSLPNHGLVIGSRLGAGQDRSQFSKTSVAGKGPILGAYGIYSVDWNLAAYNGNTANSSRQSRSERVQGKITHLGFLTSKSAGEDGKLPLTAPDYFPSDDKLWTLLKDKGSATWHALAEPEQIDLSDHISKLEVCVAGDVIVRLGYLLVKGESVEAFQKEYKGERMKCQELELDEGDRLDQIEVFSIPDVPSIKGMKIASKGGKTLEVGVTAAFLTSQTLNVPESLLGFRGYYHDVLGLSLLKMLTKRMPLPALKAEDALDTSMSLTAKGKGQKPSGLKLEGSAIQAPLKNCRQSAYYWSYINSLAEAYRNMSLGEAITSNVKNSTTLSCAGEDQFVCKLNISLGQQKWKNGQAIAGAVFPKAFCGRPLSISSTLFLNGRYNSLAYLWANFDMSHMFSSQDSFGYYKLFDDVVIEKKANDEYKWYCQLDYNLCK